MLAVFCALVCLGALAAGEQARCEREAELVKNVNALATAIDVLASSISRKCLPHMTIELKQWSPLELSGDSPASPCFLLPDADYQWLARMSVLSKAVSSQCGESDDALMLARVFESFASTMEIVVVTQTAEPSLSEVGLRSAERDKIERALSTPFLEAAVEGVSNFLPSRDAVPLFAAEDSEWIESQWRAVLRILESRGELPLCTDLPSPPALIDRIVTEPFPYERATLPRMLAYAQTRKLSFVDHATSACRATRSSPVSVLVYRRSSLVPVQSLLNASLSRGRSVVSAEWQVAWGLRLRQTTEMLAAIGYVHLRPDGNALMVDTVTGFPYFSALYNLAPINLARSSFPGTANFTDFEFAVLLQSSALAEVPGFVETFPLSFEPLIASLNHRIELSE